MQTHESCPATTPPRTITTSPQPNRRSQPSSSSPPDVVLSCTTSRSSKSETQNKNLESEQCSAVAINETETRPLFSET